MADSDRCRWTPALSTWICITTTIIRVALLRVLTATSLLSVGLSTMELGLRAAGSRQIAYLACVASADTTSTLNLDGVVLFTLLAS